MLMKPGRIIHQTFNKFVKYLTKKYNKPTSVPDNLKHLEFPTIELDFDRLEGLDVMEYAKKFVRSNIDTRIVSCDDIMSTNSYLVLIKHKASGVSFFYIPQSTNIKNVFYMSSTQISGLITNLQILYDELIQEEQEGL